MNEKRRLGGTEGPPRLVAIISLSPSVDSADIAATVFRFSDQSKKEVREGGADELQCGAAFVGRMHQGPQTLSFDNYKTVSRCGDLHPSLFINS